MFIPCIVAVLLFLVFGVVFHMILFCCCRPSADEAVMRSSTIVVVYLGGQLMRRMPSAKLRLERFASLSCPTSATP